MFPTHTFGEHCFPKGICMSISRSCGFDLDLSVVLSGGLILCVLYSCLPKANHVAAVLSLEGEERTKMKKAFLRVKKGVVLSHSQEAWQLPLF